MTTVQPSDPKVDAESKGDAIIAVTVAFTSVAAIAVGLRLYTRIGIIRITGMDDWTILAAVILSILAAALTIVEVHYGLGRHVWTLTEREGIEQLKALYATILTYNLGNNVAKLSFLLQYRRIFGGKAVRRVCLWLLIFVGAWAVVQDVLLGLTCVPIGLLVPSMADKCLEALPIWYFSSGMNILTDFVIFIVPLPSLWGLKLQKQKKILLISIFCLGFFTCIISIIRFFTLRVAAVSKDPTWDNTDVACWSLIELNCGILCASLPTLRPLIGKIVPSLGTSLQRNTEYQMYGTGRDPNKTAVADCHDQHSTSTEGLKTEPSFEGAVVDYGKPVGRLGHSTRVYSGSKAEVSNEAEEELCRTPSMVAHGRESQVSMRHNIMVTTETRVVADAENRV